MSEVEAEEGATSSEVADAGDSTATTSEGSRHRGRELALQVLYAIDLAVDEGAAHGAQQDQIFERIVENFDVPRPAENFARELVAGVVERIEKLDEILGVHARNWRVSRMAAVDRNVLRLAVFRASRFGDAGGRRDRRSRRLGQTLRCRLVARFRERRPRRGGTRGSRGMSFEIEIALTSRPLERAEAEIAVVGFFVDERPLRGGAARADWRLCGGLSHRIESGDLSGKSGEALLIGCGRALAAPRLLLLGLGDRKSFDPVRVRDEIHLAMDRCLKLGLSRIALSPLGIAQDDIPRHASALVAGLLGAWQASPRPMSVRMCIPGSEMNAVQRAFDEARAAVNAEALSIRVVEADSTTR